MSATPAPRALDPDPFEEQTSLPELEQGRDALSKGDLAAAQGLLVPVLARVRGQVADGTPLAGELAEQACVAAVQLAVATGKPAWADYPGKIYARIRRPMPTAVVEALQAAAATGCAFDVDALVRIGQALRSRWDDLDAGQRADVERLTALVASIRAR